MDLLAILAIPLTLRRLLLDIEWGDVRILLLLLVSLVRLDLLRGSLLQLCHALLLFVDEVLLTRQFQLLEFLSSGVFLTTQLGSTTRRALNLRCFVDRILLCDFSELVLLYNDLDELAEFSLVVGGELKRTGVVVRIDAVIVDSNTLSCLLLSLAILIVTLLLESLEGANLSRIP